MNAPTQLKPLQMVAKGRIDASRVHDGVRYTRLLTPAPDPYSRPQVLEIRSKGQLGARGEEVTVGVSVGGFAGAPRKFTDPQTGEITSRSFVTHVLDLIEG